MMKKFMYILGTIAPSLLILGAYFQTTALAWSRYTHYHGHLPFGSCVPAGFCHGEYTRYRKKGEESK